MHKDFRFKIISEGLKNGISVTCRKYKISRTIYYRWLKRYKSLGIEGLNDIEKNSIPINKTNSETENALLNLIKAYPHYGPRALKYLLDELGYNISESAVFNVMKRNSLTNKDKRIKFAKKRESKITKIIPSLAELETGECWIFWITDYGYFKNIGNLYSYTLFDLKSRITCTRLYNDISLNNFEDILTAVALPIATTLNLKINYLCFFKSVKFIKKSKSIFKSKISRIVQDHGLDVRIHILDTHEDLDRINGLKKQYTKECTSFLMTLINGGISFTELKIRFQKYIRNYNINDKSVYDKEICSPVEYHNKLTNTKLILPIWAYIDRKY
ncbi:helix-turn-helix domain-containing protein [Mycoplasmatota bacterium WC44]